MPAGIWFPVFLQALAGHHLFQASSYYIPRFSWLHIPFQFFPFPILDAVVSKGKIDTLLPFQSCQVTLISIQFL
jgi:hypothetical protein